MKKVALILIMMSTAIAANSQSYFAGCGFSKSYVVFPDGLRKGNGEFIVSGSIDKLDLMLGLGVYDYKQKIDPFSLGIYCGKNVTGWLSVGGYLGYELVETNVSGYYGYQSTLQNDALLMGAYIKLNIKYFQLFTFYKVSYDNNSNYKWNDRGFGFGMTIGFFKEK